MVQKYITQVLDDLDGTVLEDGKFETVKFAVDGQTYALDLSQKHVEQFHKDLGKYVEKARLDKDRSPANKASTSSKTKRSVSEDLAAIREWANKNGYTVAERGRIPTNVMDAYSAAH
jgi:hypothetical protein